MGIYIDIDIPKNCDGCPFLNEYAACTIAINYASRYGKVDTDFEKRPENCPLDEVPDEPPYGEWVCIFESTYPNYESSVYKCSICGHEVESESNFCPRCGIQINKEITRGLEL